MYIGIYKKEDRTMMTKYRLTSILAFGFATAAWGQQSPPPPAQPADGGPTLPATMQFIQEKLSEQGQVGWVQTQNNQPGVTRRILVLVSDVMADPAACTLYATGTVETKIELPKGKTLKPGGPVTVDDLHTRTIETDTVAFKQVEKITVEKLEDVQNRGYAEAAHPEITVTVTPTIFYVKLWASNAVFSVHTSTTKGNQTPVEKDTTSKTNGVSFRDEDTANSMAKAMTHAMELCGGGVTKKSLF
jgi:hypothetical protein